MKSASNPCKSGLRPKKATQDISSLSSQGSLSSPWNRNLTHRPSSSSSFSQSPTVRAKWDARFTPSRMFAMSED